MRLLALLLSACTAASLDVKDTGRPRHPHDSGPDTASTVDTAGDSGETGETGDTGPLVYDCAALPEPVVAEIAGAKGYHDVAFDGAGHLVGTDTQSLLASTYAGDLSVLVPGVTYEGIDRLPDGDFVATDGTAGELVRITPDGATTVLASGLAGAYGITIGPDGNVYVGNVHRSPIPEIARVNPDTGEVVDWLKLPMGETPRMIQFGLDSTEAYIATVGMGQVYRVTIDADLLPDDKPTVFATGVGAGWHDGLGMDACGNLYVTDYSTAGLYRVAPDASVTSLVKKKVPMYGHGLEWGSGLGGWRADAIYQPQPYHDNTVRELVIGVPSASAVRTW